MAIQTVRRAYAKRKEMEQANIPTWEVPDDLKEIYAQVKIEIESGTKE
ncbi:hypothetical protein ACTAQJ_08020 [Arthrobacter sp. alpha11c]